MREIKRDDWVLVDGGVFVGSTIRRLDLKGAKVAKVLEVNGSKIYVAPYNRSPLWTDVSRVLAVGLDPIEVMPNKIDRCRKEIADGTFETKERIDGTVDKLADEIERKDGNS